MNSLSTYIKQRINIVLWSFVTLMLITLARPGFSLSPFYSFPFILFFLLILRLFDDLASAETDTGKENRNYTNETTKNELRKFLIAAQLILLSTLALFDIQRALILLAFFIANQLLYSFLFNVSKFRYFLPLLKYSFVIYILNLELSFTLLAVFCALITFEMMEDNSFPIDKNSQVSMATLSCSLLYFDSYMTSTNDLIFLVLCLSTALVVRYKRKYSSYLFLLLFLAAHLILIYS